MKKNLLLSIVLLFSMLLAACGNEEKTTNKEDGVSTVYTTVYPLQFLTEQIGGKYVNVQSVYPPGSNEHTYEPSQKDMIDMTDADLLFYIGFNLEGFINKSKSIFEQEDVKVIPIGEHSVTDHEENHEEEALPEQDLHEEHSEDDGHNHGDVDPHIWLNPDLMKHMANEVKNELVALHPEQKQYFSDRLKTVVTKLDELDHQFKTTIDQSSKKKIIVSHSAYGYWEQRYGLEQIAVTGLANSSEPSQKELQKMMKIAKDEDIQYVLFEQNVDSKLTKIIQNEIGAESLTLHNLSVLTDENIQNKDDYFSLMQNNLESLKKALQ